MMLDRCLRKKLGLRYLTSAILDLDGAVRVWRDRLRDERRASAHTVDAYEPTSPNTCDFLTEHLGGPPGLNDLARP